MQRSAAGLCSAQGLITWPRWPSLVLQLCATGQGAWGSILPKTATMSMCNANALPSLPSAPGTSTIPHRPAAPSHQTTCQGPPLSTPTHLATHTTLHYTTHPHRYINEYPTGRLLRDAKLYEIGAGTSEIRRLLIGRELFKEACQAAGRD